MNKIKQLFKTIKRVVSTYYYVRDMRHEKLVPKEQAVSRIQNMLKNLDEAERLLNERTVPKKL